MARRPVPGLPSPEQILQFVADSDQPAGKREIARAFGLHGADKIALKALLKQMADEGLIESAPGRAFHKAGGLPKVTVLRVADADGASVFAVPENWQQDGPPPRVRVIERTRKGALGPGDRLLARIEEQGAGYVGHPMKKLARGSDLVLGVLHAEGDRLWLRHIDKKERRELPISDAGEGQPGDLVLVEKVGRPPRITGRVSEILGDPFAPRSFSLIAIHQKGIPDRFGDAVIDEAERVARFDLGEREDLRHLPIVTIDPPDARDHDDAVWAEADPEVKGGWRAIVAIADVSFYVRPGSELDREARKRGNSVYFPDRVVPMLPETLSTDVCSLVEGKDRAVLACHLTIAPNGTLKAWRFSRAVIRSVASFAYEQAQAAIDGEIAHPLTETVLKPLWGAWGALTKARDKREPLALDLPERRVVIDEKGRIASVAPREQLPAHRLIEDYMIAANVAAAKALEAKKLPVMYRDHEPPSREKLVALKDYLETFGISFALGQVIQPATFNRILDKVTDDAIRPQIMEQVLRSQTQAYYSPVNKGHFGLSLGSYAHFTSPIRRYSDLVVHRALVRGYDLGAGGLTDEEAAAMERTAEHISMAERRAMEAERDTIDRYVAAYLAQHVGEVLDTRITGVASFGFFATVADFGGDGLVPVSTLGAERFRFDDASKTLEGEESGETYRPGMTLPLRLVQADPASGALRFELPEGGGFHRKDERGRPRPLKRRGRPPNIRHKGGRR